VEQIRYLQALWDRIAEKPGEIAVPESHLALAEERLAEYRRDPSRAQPARDVLNRLANKER
jgi:putative addiction module component (TIGR02574 family)